MQQRTTDEGATTTKHTNFLRTIPRRLKRKLIPEWAPRPVQTLKQRVQLVASFMHSIPLQTRLTGSKMTRCRYQLPAAQVAEEVVRSAAWCIIALSRPRHLQQRSSALWKIIACGVERLRDTVKRQ